MEGAALDVDRLLPLLRPIFGATTKVVGITALGRGAVWRVQLASDVAPVAVIVKQHGRDESTRLDDEAGVRFFSGSGWSPEFIAVDRSPWLLVMQDLAGGSLADCLLGDDFASARRGVLMLAETLAAMHLDGMARVGEYRSLRESLGPERSRYLRHRPSSFATLRERLHEAGVVERSGLSHDLDALDGVIADPGPFSTFVHGDPCPDNVVLGDVAGLFDFEWGGIGHGLLDACFLQVPFPTCWCYGTIPEGVVTEFESTYRRRLADGCPSAEDDNLWSKAFTAASGSWWLAGIDEFLAPAFDADRAWGTATLRQRVLHRTQRFSDLVARTGEFPALGDAAARLASVWRSRWHDLTELEPYPAFRASQN